MKFKTENFLQYALEQDNTDEYFDENKCVQRLLDEYKKYNRLVVAYDFDGTVNGKDLGTKGSTDCVKMIELIRRCKSVGCKLIVFTARQEKDYPKVAEYLKEHEIPFDYINENIPEMKKDCTSKIFYNIFFDDRAGLSQSYDIMTKVLDILENQSKQSN